ncbi:beta and beta-prime subunits of DNA dependent RNA-polymerase [Pholiota conissans]|uniref:DNA-directed RNA polymerase subunit n=1 Tax=Pholiota conissans TaxID=109636 RepID=A0A9P5YZX2_9AGAR|nr:beta and beta-prime subunits of DNA dependent RNA-polymerase [Pholiota conissans]
MNISHSLPATVTNVSFTFLTSEDIRRISVKQIVNPVLLDDLNRPNIGGLYDPALGPSDRSDICSTCHLTYFTCPGHYGHIELPAPVFHPLFMGNMFNLLRGTCMFCHRFKMSRTMLWKYLAKLRLLERGLLEAAQGVDDIKLRVRSKEKKKPKANDEGDEEESVEEEEEPGVPDETPELFIGRINLYVAIHLSRAPKNTRDSYKDGLIYQARKDLINDFLKSCILKKCQNDDCECIAYTYRKEGHIKVIEYDLSSRQKGQLNRKRPNVLLAEKAGSFSLLSDKPTTADVELLSNGDDEDEDNEEGLEGDDVMSDAEKKDPVLPRAANGKVKTARGRNERVVTPEECRAHLRRLFHNEQIMCALVFGRHGPFAVLSPDQLSYASADMFFMEVIPVAPTRFRPPAKMGDTLFEHPQNELLARVLQTSYRMRDLNIGLREASQKSDDFDEATRKTIMTALLDRLVQLQIDVNSFMDSSKNPQIVRQGKLPPAGVKQGLEKKEGLFRKHMMGKRVNYAARSVISPDVNIEPNEIGIPPVFARKLTFAEPVTPANFHEMRQLVINGPHIYPGASMVEYEDGHQQSLDKLTVEQRTAIANQLLTPQEGDRAASGQHGLFTRTTSVNKKVYRHLHDGDVLILNRQPTLHKPSMMTHKARVLKGEKTIRMHYANCNSYNADFDGDEMNIHFPQNHVARAEGMFIANTDNQYLVPTSGNPIRGLIQDHVVAGVWMTSQNTFFDREEYFQLLYGALRPEDEVDPGTRLITLPPTIWKPKPLWTGKQIISTVLKNLTPSRYEGLNLNAKTKVPGKLWGADSQEDKVVFMDGELLCGVLDKAAFGASDYGLVHSVYELYGSDIAGKLLGVLSRLFTKFLQHRAFTCRMDDLMLTPTGDRKRVELLEQGKNWGQEGAIDNFPSLDSLSKAEIPSALRDLLEDVLRDDNKMAGLDMTVKTKLSKLTSSISDKCLPDGLLRKFPYNHMQTMTLSGAKGSAVNVRQISCGLGQQELEGRRVPVMISGKTLPSFRPFETRAIAGGYVASRFLTGIKPQEFYFHCMAGREGLIDTAVKTSRSGYLQRCLIKHLEGIRVHYDNTVRGSDNSIYQFAYGGDALDVTKQKHLYQFDFIAQNSSTFVRRLEPYRVKNAMDHNTAVDYMKTVLSKSNRKRKHEFAPALSLYNPSRYLGSTSEEFAVAVQEYVKSKPQHLADSRSTKNWKSRRDLLSTKNFKSLMHHKYMRSLVEPGEAVGLIASQGVGEPSTQMTLNTFHFAGHGAANVTLGIPRLREIVMTASQKPKTPSMTMKVKAGVSGEEVTLFCKRASRITLSQIVENVTVQEELHTEGDARRTYFLVNIDFYPKEEYQDEYDLEPNEILSSFGVQFPLNLKKEIISEMKKLDADLKSQMSQLGQGKRVNAQASETEEDEEGAAAKKKKGDDEGSENGDGDADEEKHARQKKQQATYDSDDEDDVEEVDAFDDATLEAALASDDEAPKTEVKQHKKSFQTVVESISAMFQKHMQHCISFTFREEQCTFKLEFNTDMPKLLFVGIVERACRGTVIREIPGISECFQVKDVKPGESGIKLTTNGSNLRGMWDFASGSDESILEDDETYSNDIYAILKTYGVEMARAAILREMKGIFAVYSIDVNKRHLELIADYMTFDGGYKPFNRKGISTNPSPLLKASYETTAAFLSDATLFGDFDGLTTPSGNIVIGRPNATGTGVFDVVMPADPIVS